MRTCDRVDFRVHKFILRRASPVFRDMFSLPQMSPEIPVIDVTENSGTWNHVLRIYYCPGSSASDGLDHVAPLSEAAEKYQMEGVRGQMKQTLLARYSLGADPLRVFSLACCTHNDEVARLAAESILRHWKPAEEPGSYVKEL
ncbi:hypothetical protein AcW1_002477 [Taiwanofungus camphoratus]|nr:hypothetical protein AcV5_009862 [Antrodia cinnamomea]KAI0926565.1 hypothetical protein AcV7_005460 [Antrodia cinnamomea]KAI0943268.1 hypothetical protein AcW1_002477 [Antrodia cinnamomea]